MTIQSSAALQTRNPIADFSPFRLAAAQNDFERYMLKYRGDLHRFAIWFTRDPVIAEDAVQEASLRAWKSWHRLRDRTAVKSWLLMIVRRECARVYERKKLPTNDIAGLTAADQFYIAVEDDESTLDIQRAILNLHKSYREPMILQVFMGFKAKEIAEILEITPGAVLTRLFRARQKLNEQFSDAD